MHGCRDNEFGYVSINDKQCWSKEFVGANGTQTCGSSRSTWKEESVHVQCQANAVDGKLKVRAYTDLSSTPEDESFAIDNVVVTKLVTSANFKFENKRDFEGWNCGEITLCGKYGHVCGGYQTTGSGHVIKQTFAVPTGEYAVSLEFIKIDSWFVHLC